jgi:phosphoethanolamine N-methyltransferase
MTDTGTFYTDDLVENLQYRFGTGFLSPGGVTELRLMFDGVPVENRHVVDFGCGLGGYDVELVHELGAAHVTGVDVEPGLLAEARSRASASGLDDRLGFDHVPDGPLPYDAGRFDIAFSKDAIVHLPDKAAVLAELYRVTKPGGWLVLADWFGADAPMTAEMRAWASDGAETFHMASLGEIASLAREHGFIETDNVDRNAWFQEFCRDELARLEGPLFDTYTRRFGPDQARRSVANARVRLQLAEQGQLRPGHICARKPLCGHGRRSR